MEEKPDVLTIALRGIFYGMAIILTVNVVNHFTPERNKHIIEMAKQCREAHLEPKSVTTIVGIVQVQCDPEKPI